jgi:hypothetical protein
VRSLTATLAREREREGTATARRTSWSVRPGGTVTGIAGVAHDQANFVRGRDRFGPFGFGGLNPNETLVLQRPKGPQVGGRFGEALR